MALTIAQARERLKPITSGSLRELGEVLRAFIDGDFNGIAGVTASAAEINVLDGVTATTAEINDVTDIADTAVAATSDGLTTGLIPATANFVTITSANADYIVTLPAIGDVGLGKEIWGKNGATACEMRTPASSNTAINGGDADTNEAVIAANVSFLVKKTSATNWALLTFTGGAVACPTPD